MTPTTFARAALFCVVLLCLAATSMAQVCPPTPAGFDGLTGISQLGQTDNGAVLDIFTANDPSDAVNADNTAEAYVGEPIAIQFGTPRVPAGNPMSICYSVGFQPFAQTPPNVDGDIWLDISGGNFYTIVDGLGLTKPIADPNGATPGPTNLYTLFAATTSGAGAVGVCVTFQTILIDPLAPAPAFVTFSNPIAFGINPGFLGMTPSIASAGTTVSFNMPGAVPGDGVTFPAGPGSSLGTGLTAPVPTGAVSGPVTGLVNIWNTLGTTDGLEDWIVVTNPNPPFQNGGALTLTANPNLPLPGQLRGSAYSSLPGPTGTETFSVALNAGDIIEVEVYSTDLLAQNALDGRGLSINPFAQEGFDPFVTLQLPFLVDQLYHDDPNFTGANAPFNLHFDDNSGPENNAFLRFQVKWSGTYDLVVGNINPASFATGVYLINVLVTPGAPCVQRFKAAGASDIPSNRRNIVPQAGMIDMVCANVDVGSTYTVDLIPKAGAPFTTRTITGVPCTTPNVLTLTIPNPGATDLPMGLHQVRLYDEITFEQGLVWDNSQFTPVWGVLPDLLCIRGATTQMANAANVVQAGSNIMGINALNTESILLPAPNQDPTSLASTFFFFNVLANDPGGSSVAYLEALGVNETTNDLFDTGGDFENMSTNGIYNPYVRSFAYSLINPGPYNDDDGTIPNPLFPTPLGIGFSAAVIDTTFPALAPAGGVYSWEIGETVVFGGFQFNACLVNVVIQ